MEAINSKSINEAVLNNSKQTLSKMERALTMIDDPDFGLCCEGEEPIPFTRLMISEPLCPNPIFALNVLLKETSNE